MNTPDGVRARVARSLLRVFVGSGVSKGTLISAELLLAAILGASGYGIFSIAFALVLVLPALCQVGLNFGVVQYLGIYGEEGDDSSMASVARVSILVVLSAGVLIGALLLGLREWLAVEVFEARELVQVFVVVGLIVPMESFNQCCSAIFRGLRKFRYHVLAQDLLRNAMLLGGIPLVLVANLGIEFVFWMILGGSMLAGVVSLMALNRSVALWSWASGDMAMMRRLLSFSYLLFFWQVLQKTSNQLMVLIAGAILIKPEVGILALAVRLSTLLNFPQSVVNATTPVEFARYWHRGEPGGIANLLQSLALMLSTLGISYLLVVGLNSEAIFSAFGGQYAGFGWVLSVLLVAKAVEVGLGPVGQILVACRRRKTVFVIGTLDLVAQLFLVVPMMLVWGLPGAALGNAVRAAAILSLRHVVLYFQTGIHAFSRELNVLLLVGLGFAALVWLVTNDQWGLWTVFVCSLAAVGCFGAVAWRLLSGNDMVWSLVGRRVGA